MLMSIELPELLHKINFDETKTKKRYINWERSREENLNIHAVNNYMVAYLEAN